MKRKGLAGKLFGIGKGFTRSKWNYSPEQKDSGGTISVKARERRRSSRHRTTHNGEKRNYLVGIAYAVKASYRGTEG